MEKRFSRVYPFYVAVAAYAVAAFLLVYAENKFPACNLFVTIFIYYNGMATYDPTEEKALLGRGVLCRL